MDEATIHLRPIYNRNAYKTFHVRAALSFLIDAYNNSKPVYFVNFHHNLIKNNCLLQVNRDGIKFEFGNSNAMEKIAWTGGGQYSVADAFYRSVYCAHTQFAPCPFCRSYVYNFECISKLISKKRGYSSHNSLKAVISTTRFELDATHAHAHTPIIIRSHEE